MQEENLFRVNSLNFCYVYTFNFEPSNEKTRAALFYSPIY